MNRPHESGGHVFLHKHYLEEWRPYFPAYPWLEENLDQYLELDVESSLRLSAYPKEKLLKKTSVKTITNFIIGKERTKATTKNFFYCHRKLKKHFFNHQV